MEIIQGDREVLEYQPISLESYPGGFNAQLRGGLSAKVTIGIENLWSGGTLNARSQSISLLIS